MRRALRMAGYDVLRFDPGGLTVREHLAALLPRLGVDCVLDVGAHRGEFGRLLRTAGSGDASCRSSRPRRTPTN